MGDENHLGFRGTPGGPLWPCWVPKESAPQQTTWKKPEDKQRGEFADVFFFGGVVVDGMVFLAFVIRLFEDKSIEGQI